MLPTPAPILVVHIQFWTHFILRKFNVILLRSGRSIIEVWTPWCRSSVDCWVIFQFKSLPWNETNRWMAKGRISRLILIHWPASSPMIPSRWWLWGIAECIILVHYSSWNLITKPGRRSELLRLPHARPIVTESKRTRPQVVRSSSKIASFI